MLFDETFIMNPTWNKDGQIIKEIIDKTIDLGQNIGSNVGFEGHAQGVGVVLPIAPNQFQDELDSSAMPSDPRRRSNEIVGILDLELETLLVIIKLVEVPNVAVGTRVHKLGTRQRRPTIRYGKSIYLVDRTNYAYVVVLTSILNKLESFEEVMAFLRKEQIWIQAM